MGLNHNYLNKLNHLKKTNFKIEEKFNLLTVLFETRFTVRITLPSIENSTSPIFWPSKIGAFKVSDSFISCVISELLPLDFKISASFSKTASTEESVPFFIVTDFITSPFLPNDVTE